MKNIFMLLLLTIPLLNSAQSFIPFGKSVTDSKIIINEGNRFSFRSSVGGVYFSEVKTNDGLYTKVVIPGYFPNNDIGNPELPVMTKLIELPYNSDIVITTNVISSTVLYLDEIGFDKPIVPGQPSLRKDQDPDLISFEKNQKIYSDKELYSTNIVKIEELGIMRGVQLAQLIVNPFVYNIDENTLTILDEIEVEIIFRNADMAKASNLKSEKYSPAFSQFYNNLWNYVPSQSKDQLSRYPIKYVIVSDRMFEDALQPFIEWKTKKGFNVVTAYTDEIGTSTSSIKSYLQNLYDSGTADDPAPSYLLVVGDVAQVPSFQMSGHVSDLYYCTFDGSSDYTPDMYFGRFSATNVSELLPQIEKTLMFEQYSFADPSYLDNIILVAGNDSYYGPTHANGQMNYASTYYFNSERGVNVNAYMHPQSNSQSSTIRNNINSGSGFVNYTAHCDADGWAGPEFTVNNVYNLTNVDEYFFSIGNCCQSNKFEESVCFGEALLRSSKKGAVIHLGGSDNTYWNEDYYWSIGLSSSFTANPTYEGTGPGVYDHLFHENGEEPYITSGQMNYAGNMSVMSSTSSRKKYYWEIYHVMGDPSLMPYVGVPQQITADYMPVLTIGMSSLTVNTETNAYVAISKDGILLDAKLVDSNGIATLEFPALAFPGNADLVITKQFRAPLITQIPIVGNDNDHDAALINIINPTNNIHITNASFSASVTIMNIGQINMQSAVVGYYINEDEPVEFTWTGDLETLGTEIYTFPEITLSDGDYSFTAYIHSPNGEEDENTINNQISKEFGVYSGIVKIQEIISPGNNICNQSSFSPEITIKNEDSYPLTSLVCEYECGTISFEFTWEGNIAPGAIYNIQFPEAFFPDGVNEITFNISQPNGGSNKNSSNISLSKTYYLVYIGDRVILEFKTDGYPDENSWELIDNNTSQVLYSENSFESSTVHNYEWCLGTGCYKYTVYDSYGDGMGNSWSSNKGYIKITNTTTGEQIMNIQGNEFTRSSSVEFCIDVPGIVCPDDITKRVNDEMFLLIGGLPGGGVYSGIGVENGSFDPSVAGIGTHEITYAYEDESCTFNINILDMLVLDCPEDITVNYEDDPFLLNGASPEGGTYSGIGVSGEYFVPMSANEGTHEITYTLENVSCKFYITVLTPVAIYCPESSNVSIIHEEFELRGGIPTGGVYSGTGVSDGNFNPLEAGIGVHKITYTYNNLSCEYNITVLPSEGIYCPENIMVNITDEQFLLTGGLPLGGIYSGLAIENGYFDPSVAGSGAHEITFKYEDLSCTFIITVIPRVSVPENNTSDIEIYPNPTNGTFNIKNVANSNIEIFNVMGQSIKNVLVTNNDITIDLSNHPEGTYFIKVILNDDIITKKISIQK